MIENLIGVLQVVVPVGVTIIGAWIALSSRIAKLEQRIINTEQDVDDFKVLMEKLNDSISDLSKNVAKLEGRLEGKYNTK